MEKARYLSQERYSHHEEKADGIQVYTTEGACIQVVVCSSFVFRTWVRPDGMFEKRDSFAVGKEQWDFKEYTVVDAGDKLCIKTDVLCLEINKEGLGISYHLQENGRVLLKQVSGEGPVFGEEGSLRADYELAEEEHIYGLGEDNDAYKGNLDRKGSSRDLVTGQTINKGCVTADIPIPFFLSTGRCAAGEAGGMGYGLFVDNTYHMEFDMGKERKDSFFWKAKGGEAVSYFIFGPAFKDIMNRYTDLTGKPGMLPLWTLGFMQCKCSYWDWEELEDVAGTLLEKGFPLDALVFDYDWPEHLHDFKWNQRWKGLSPSKIKEYRKKGIHFLVSNTGPMIKKDSSNYQDALDHGVMALDAGGNTLTCGHYGGDLMDFSAPAMKEWIKKQLIPLMDDGVEGWWLDLTEPEGEPVQTLYQGGTKEELHNVYSYLNSKVYYDSHKEYMPRTRPFILTRTGTPGIQRMGNSIWSGDVYSDYATFEAHCPEALNTGMSGIPYWTSDIGGFISSTYDSANPRNVQLYQNDAAAHGLLYERWFQFGCFCPITRAHHAGPSEPYRFGKLVEEGCKHYINLRYQLLPYIYKYMWEAHHNGLSIMRPLVLEYQMDEKVYGIKDEFLFGEYLLVAPVLTECTTEREVYFPEGSWIDWDYGYEYVGGETYRVYAPQNRIPLFVKKGAIIPMVTERSSTYESPWDPVILDLYPGGESKFSMYQDDGQSMDYEDRKLYTETTFTGINSGEEYNLKLERSNDHFRPSRYELKIHDVRIVERVFLEDVELPLYKGCAPLKKAESGVFVDELEQMCYVKVNSAAERKQSIRVVFGGEKWEKAVPGKDMTLEDKQMPYFLPPATVPCRIQAENFDRGGEGSAYHMEHGENAGGQYRSEAVNIELCSDIGGGYDVFDLTAGEWLEYTVNITKNLTAKNLYHILLRLSCCTPDTRVHVEVDADNKSGSIAVPANEDGKVWETLTVSDRILQEGEHIVKFYVESGCVCLNYMEIEIA